MSRLAAALTNLLGCCVLLILGAAAPAAAQVTAAAVPVPPVVGAASAWVWPLHPPPVLQRPFERPPAPYAAGHRGVDLRGSVGADVLAAGPGVVTFAGMVAGRGVVVVLHADGLRTTYEPVEAGVAVGQRVEAGERLGALAGGPESHCAPAACLHWGLLRGTDYLDPLLLLRQGPSRLLPVWGIPVPYDRSGAARSGAMGALPSLSGSSAGVSSAGESPAGGSYAPGPATAGSTAESAAAGSTAESTAAGSTVESTAAGQAAVAPPRTRSPGANSAAAAWVIFGSTIVGGASVVATIARGSRMRGGD